jgi:CBS domain-containing protein
MENTGLPGQVPVSELVEDNVVRVAPGATLIEVTEILRSAEVGALVVGDGPRPMAIVSERDLAHSIAERCDPTTTSTIDVGHRTLIWCDATASVAEVGTEMMEHDVRHVLVEMDGKLIGVAWGA